MRDLNQAMIHGESCDLRSCVLQAPPVPLKSSQICETVIDAWPSPPTAVRSDIMAIVTRLGG